MKTLVAVAFVLSTAISAALAGGPCYTGYCKPTYAAPVYAAPVVQKVVYPTPSVTVVNNLIGVPVPIAYEKPLALQGHSVYGYTKVSEVFAPVDAALYLDKAERLTSQAITLAQTGRSGFDDAVRDQIQAQKEVAQSLAVGQVARELVDAIGKAQRQQAALAAARPGVLKIEEVPTTASGVLKARCVTCHEKYNDWGALSRDDQLRLIGRITTADPGKRMPRGADKQSAGESVAVEELGLLYKELKP